MVRYELITTEFDIALAQGLGVIGRAAEAAGVINETIQRVETNGDVVYMPELLRVKGCLLLLKLQLNAGEAQLSFERSLELSQRQGARAWELRTATDLAALFGSQGRPDLGRALLQPVFEQFVDGSDTLDLKAAERRLAMLG